MVELTATMMACAAGEGAKGEKRARSAGRRKARASQRFGSRGKRRGRPTSRLDPDGFGARVAHLDIVVLDRRTAAARVGSKERRDVLLSEKIERARNQHRGAHLQIMS